MSLHIKTQYRMFFIQTSTLTPSMHQELLKHGKFCIQNNQLPSNTPVELTDNSCKQTSSSIGLLISYHQLAFEQRDYRALDKFDLLYVEYNYNYKDEIEHVDLQYTHLWPVLFTSSYCISPNSTKSAVCAKCTKTGSLELEKVVEKIR